MAQKPTAAESQQAKLPKEQWLRARIDADLLKQAREKAKQQGWKLGAVIRLLLKHWLREDLLTNEEMAEEQRRAPKVPKAKAASRRRRR